MELQWKIKPLDEGAMDAARERQARLAKPPGSLGRLEALSIQLAGITGKVKNDVSKKIHFVFGADNGVFDEGVTASPKHFTNMLMDSYGNYLLGSDTEWVDYEALNTMAHRGSIHPGEVFTYFLSWEWVFEVSDEQDAYDTYLGSQNGEILPGVRVGIETQASANPTPVKDNRHMMHLLGEGFGCCWCCYIVWLLLLVCLLLLIWVWHLRKKLSKYEETMEEYEKVLTIHGLMVDGELVEQIHAK